MIIAVVWFVIFRARIWRIWRTRIQFWFLDAIIFIISVLFTTQNSKPKHNYHYYNIINRTENRSSYSFIVNCKNRGKKTVNMESKLILTLYLVLLSEQTTPKHCNIHLICVESEAINVYEYEILSPSLWMLLIWNEWEERPIYIKKMRRAE